MKNNKFEVLISQKRIEKRVKKLAKQISKDYQDKEPIFICALKGAFFFFADLVKKLTIPITSEFVRISSYVGTESGEISLKSNLSCDIENKDVIIVEDIVDTGKTLSFYVDLLKGKNPTSIKICSLLDKPSKRIYPITADYVGFTIPDEFVIGYGLDYNEHFRELPFVAIYKE